MTRKGVFSHLAGATFQWLLDRFVSGRQVRQSWKEWHDSERTSQTSFGAAMAWVAIFLPLGILGAALLALVHEQLPSHFQYLTPISWLPAFTLGLAIGGLIVNYARHLVSEESSPSISSDSFIMVFALLLGGAALIHGSWQ